MPLNVWAFPQALTRAQDFIGAEGMTLRDYFAGQALAGLLARSDLRVPHCPECRDASDDPGEHYADISYRYADAMLAERERT